LILTLWSAWIIGFYFYTALNSYPAYELPPVSRGEFSKATHGYYDFLTKSLAQGHLDLGIQPSKKLLALANPYDPKGRDPNFYLLDISLYQSKYFLYFGITPVLTLFLPFYALTGFFFPSYLAAALFCCLGYLFSLLSLISLWRIYANSSGDLIHQIDREAQGPLQSSKSATLTALVLGMGNFAPFVLQQPYVYQIAVASGFCFGMGGIYALTQCWRRLDCEISFPIWMGMSGLLLALSVGSRPSLIVLGVIPIILFWYLYRSGKLSFVFLGSFLLPYGSYGLALAFYNYLRFGSWCEFGFRYQLNPQDNLHRAISLQNLLAGLNGFLLQPPEILAGYPYITLHWVWPFPSVWHSVYQDPVLGALWIFPLVPLGFFVLRSSHHLSRSPYLQNLLRALLGIAMILFILNSIVAITPRYLMEALVYLLVPSLFCSFLFLKESKLWRKQLYELCFSIAAIWCAGAVFFLSSQGVDGLDRLEKIKHFMRASATQPQYCAAVGEFLMLNGREEEGIQEFQRYLEYCPSSSRVHQRIGVLIFLHGKRKEGLDHLLRSYELEPLPDTANDLAWMLATAPEDDLRNGQESLVLALQANKSAGGKNPYILDTLAAAYAEMGDFENALENGRAALKIAEASGNKELAFGLKKEIALYYEGKPFRQP